MMSCCVRSVQFYLFYMGLDTVFQKTSLAPKNPKVLEGSSLTLSCRHEGEQTSLSSTWTSTYKDLLILLLFDGYTDQCTVHAQYLPSSVNPKCSPDIFNLSLSPVLNEMHGSKWTCSQSFENESVTSLYVEVPVKKVTMSLEDGKQPTILICVENESLYLECKSSFGRPPPSITWLIGDSYSDASVVSTAENTPVSYNASDETYNYTLTVLRLNVKRTWNNKRIFCNSTNLADVASVSSNYIVFDVHYPPVIKEMQDIAIIERKKISFLCPVTRGNPVETSFRWTRELNNKEWRTETLTIDYVSRHDEDVYTCIVTNTMRLTYDREELGLSNKSLYMNVLYPPEGFSVAYSKDNIRHEHIPDTIKLVQGIYVTLSCSARSNPPPLSYAWSGDITVYSANISFTAKKSQSGEYICSASNVMKEVPGDKTTGINKKIYHIDVLYPPEVNQMQNMTVIEGTPFSLNCPVVYGNPKDTTMKWVRTKDNMTWNSQILSFGNITRSDDSIYTCIANNTLSPTYGEHQIGLSSNSAHIEILYKTSIKHFMIEGYTKHTDNIVTVNESQTISFTCSVDSNPKSFIKLTSEGKLLPERNGSNELVYFINRTKCTDAGTYVCHGNNWLNNPSETPNTYLILYVNCAPRQSSTVYPATNVTNVSSVQHVSTTLTLKALAYPTPRAQWYRKYNLSWMKLDIESNGNMEIVSAPDVLEYNLTLFSISKEDYGQYRLDINNPFGNHTQVFNLIPKDKPKPPNRFEFDEQNVTETSVSLWWEPGFDGGLPQTFLMQYKEEKSAWFNYTTLEHMNQTIMHITVTGLKSGTQYHFKIIASNDLGSSTTKELFIRTKDIRMTSTVTVDNVGPAVGGAVGAVLAIVLTIIIGLIIRSRISRGARETPIYQNTSSLRDRMSSVHVSGSNHYETLQTRGSEQRYQQLSSFARESLTDQRKIYENLKLSQAREHPDIEPATGSPTTSTQSETQSVL